MNNSELVSFVRVTTKDVLNFIKVAKKRIIFAKPAFLKQEVKFLYDAVKEKSVYCNLYMEAGDAAIRYGFGETSALEFINEKFGAFSVHTADRIRIAILIVDDKALVYMPNLAFIEEEASELSFPNGFMCNEDITKEIVNQFEEKTSNNDVVEKVENVILLPGGYIPLLDSVVVNSSIKESIKSLKDNPAPDPAKLKKVQFYRNNYKILKMQICGVRIENKKINLRSFYNLLPEVNKRLRSSWNILESKDIDELQDTKSFERELKKIKDNYKEYLFDAGRFGSIIDVRKKSEFEEEINKLKEDYKKYLGKNADEEVKERFGIVDSNEDSSKTDLETLLKKSREELEEHLLKQCIGNIQFLNKVFNECRHLKEKNNNEGMSQEEVLKEYINIFVMDKLKFTDIDEIISKIDIKLDWFDLSDELIFNNNDFKEIIGKYKLELRKTSEGYEGKNL